MRYIGLMTKIMEKAVAELALLPDELQERVGRTLLNRIADWQTLNADIDAGRQQIADGLGKAAVADEILSRARKGHEIGKLSP